MPALLRGLERSGVLARVNLHFLVSWSSLICSAIFWLGVPKFCIQITRTLLKKSSISAESSRRDTSKSEVFSVLGALACTHDLLKVRPKCHYGVFFAQNFSLAKVITLANLTMHMYEVWPAVTPK